MKSPQPLILGAGLTGLSNAYYLKQKGINATILEARPRLGGRIHTAYADNSAPLEMGATWLGQQHTELQKFLKELGIGIFEQALGDRAIYEPISTSPPQLVMLPPNNDPSFRIQGGTSAVIQKLRSFLSDEQVLLNQQVISLEQEEDGVLVKTKDREFKTSVVISTLPPNLLIHSIEISPELPNSLTEIAGGTHTWMGESIKVGLTYEKPFWRNERSSGTIFSSVGPIPEMYDHSNYEDSHYALKGFFNGSYFSVSREERLTLVMKQLNKYFGPQANDYLSYEEAAWRNEPFTFADYQDHVLPHQNNGHSVYQRPYLDGKLFIAGAETSPAFPGYMEGAVRSAQAVCEQIVAKL